MVISESTISTAMVGVSMDCNDPLVDPKLHRLDPGSQKSGKTDFVFFAFVPVYALSGKNYFVSNKSMTISVHIGRFLILSHIGKSLNFAPK